MEEGDNYEDGNQYSSFSTFFGLSSVLLRLKAF